MCALVGIAVALVRDDSNLGNRKRGNLETMEELSGKPYRGHAISLMNAIIPGLDGNNIPKMMVAFQVSIFCQIIFTLS